MQDAALLSLIDATGAMLWHPRGLADFGVIPDRTLTLWGDIQQGRGARDEPWAWWRIRGIPTSHHFPAVPQGRPTVARCGEVADPAADWMRAPDATPCRVCTALIENETRPTQGFGSIGGTPIERR